MLRNFVHITEYSWLNSYVLTTMEQEKDHGVSPSGLELLCEQLKMYIYAICTLRQVDALVIKQQLDESLSLLSARLVTPEIVAESQKQTLQEINELAIICINVLCERHQFEISDITETNFKNE